METKDHKIKHLIICKKQDAFIELLRSGFDPNFEGGWPIRLAARYGCSKIVEALLQFGANPHLLSESGASTLQLAVFSGKHWKNNKWTSLLSCCDSSQLADAAAVAIIFKKVAALNCILSTGRCNTNIPTTLTGKTVEVLAQGYGLTHLINPPTVQNNRERMTMSPRISRLERMVERWQKGEATRLKESWSPTATSTLRRLWCEYQRVSCTPSGKDFWPQGVVFRRFGGQVPLECIVDRATLSPYPAHAQARNLSPSVARFFHQTASQSSLSPTRGIVPTSSSIADTNC